MLVSRNLPAVRGGVASQQPRPVARLNTQTTTNLLLQVRTKMTELAVLLRKSL
jgi:hypothetical protein